MPTALGRRVFRQRVESLRRRVTTLSELRRLVGLPARADISRRQWSVLEPRVASVQSRLLARLREVARAHLGRLDSTAHARRLNNALGEIELELSTAFTFFDTYVDVLAQRHAPELGALLAGCDVLAWDAMKRNHQALALVEPPLVYCERGFGAAIIRETVPFPDRTPNPMPLIQIPYSRLREKYLLTSILHEAGHQALALLGLVDVLPRAIAAALARRGASETLQGLYARWSSEIGPDLWTFCLGGAAASAGLRDLLSLPAAHVMRISWTDPHPPPYLRTLIAFELCRQQWGGGSWDGWERDWLALYPLEQSAPTTRRLLQEAVRHVRTVCRTLLTTRFRSLSGEQIVSLFDLAVLDPARLRTRWTAAGPDAALPPSAQLAAFRQMRDEGVLSEDALDRHMTRWLINLGRTRDALPAVLPQRGEYRYAQ